MRIKLIEPKQISLKKRTLVVPFFKKTAKVKIGNKKIEVLVEKALKQSPSSVETPFFYFLNSFSLVLFNLGEEKKWDRKKIELSIRKIVRFLKKGKIKKAVLLLEHLPYKGEKEEKIEKIIQNIYLADYEFGRYKKEEKKNKIESLEVVVYQARKYEKVKKQGEVIGQMTNFVRDLTNTPAQEMTPVRIAYEAKQKAKKIKNIQLEIFNQGKIKKLGLNALLKVAQGSKEEPRLIILKYKGKPKNKKINLLLVGKGVTFDSGGLNIKPDKGMDEMWMDMEGAAVVLGAVLAIAQLKLPLNVVSVLPAVENMPSGRSYRPGDVIKMYNKKTVEIGSTDAEGRLILADALSYAIERFKPQIVVDIATLTGAAVIALGKRKTAIFTNQDNWENILRKIGDESGDYVWPLPADEEYEEDIKGKVGEISNTGKTQEGGAIFAAVFLKNFINQTPWIHLDIAPTMCSIEGQGLAKGATGAGTRYLVKLARNFRNIPIKK